MAKISESPVPSAMGGSRTLNYSYDGLQRLTSATESPGALYTYAFDLAGNRTDQWVNGALIEHRTYNAANQMSGWNYDANGNLLSDGANTSTYDALNRPISLAAFGQTRSNSYNGDGALVAQTANGVATLFTQDLATPLSQVLQTKVGAAAITDYLYGLNRLASLNRSTKIWYAADALGSVRRTVADSGTPLGIVNYDPWGTPESGTTSYASNGDGTLVSQATGGVTTRYTQDLAAPLSQVLQIKVGSAAITDYSYGLNRLASLNSGAKTWYVADALGSVYNCSLIFRSDK